MSASTPEQRDVAGLAGVQGLHREIEVEPGAAAPRVPELPRLERLSVQLRGLLRRPGRVGGHAPRELAQGPETPLDLAERGGVCEGDLAVLLVLRAASAFAEHGASGNVRREGLDADLAGEGDDASLVRPDPLPAHLDGVPRRRCPAIVRPPTLSWASITITEAPAASSFLAAVSPASPAPTTTASTAAISWPPRCVNPAHAFSGFRGARPGSCRSAAPRSARRGRPPSSGRAARTWRPTSAAVPAPRDASRG